VGDQGVGGGGSGGGAWVRLDTSAATTGVLRS
jgi:hypothetical protein